MFVTRIYIDEDPGLRQSLTMTFLVRKLRTTSRLTAARSPW
ncbi:MAG: hypothetical protein ACRDOH_03765 [Streptosporangiaceae bacterium]